jgi:hypothetical protein
MGWLCKLEEGGKVKEFCVREKAPVLATGPTRETMLRLHTIVSLSSVKHEQFVNLTITIISPSLAFLSRLAMLSIL